MSLFLLERLITLTTERRPIDPSTGVRMTPEVLYNTQKAHPADTSSNPTCLCSLKGINTVSSDLGFQTSVVRAVKGLHTGEYIIQCSLDRCGYVGQSSILNLKSRD